MTPAALLALALLLQSAPPPAPRMLALEGDLERVHDPVLTKEGDTYYLFSTGGRPGAGIIPIRCSKDLRRWSACGAVFEKLPEWVANEVPKARGAWAPDISYFNGKFHLYYAVSSFGSRNSAIGLATTKTLGEGRQWVDEGMVLRSYEEKDDWNAIDANIVIESKDRVWMAWGSFWGGLKMKRIDPKTGKLSSDDTGMYSLASRPRTPDIRGSIEAPFIVRHDGWWYLFASFDFCCRGAKSTYNIVAGRSKSVTGPYVDRSGKPMAEGGGTLVLAATTDNWRGPGHNAMLQEPTGDYLVFHAYHGQTGRSFLHISTLVWEDGWPRAAALP